MKIFLSILFSILFVASALCFFEVASSIRRQIKMGELGDHRRGEVFQFNAYGICLLLLVPFVWADPEGWLDVVVALLDEILSWFQ
jgi:Ca2+/Na+ antiporter